WDTSEMGAGIADAQGLLTANFEVGLGLESAIATGSEPPEAATKRFVSETVGISAASAPIDWTRFGPEIVLSLLSRKAGRPPTLRGIGMESAALTGQTPL